DIPPLDIYKLSSFKRQNISLYDVIKSDKLLKEANIENIIPVIKKIKLLQNNVDKQKKIDSQEKIDNDFNFNNFCQLQHSCRPSNTIEEMLTILEQKQNYSLTDAINHCNFLGVDNVALNKLLSLEKEPLVEENNCTDLLSDSATGSDSCASRVLKELSLLEDKIKNFVKMFPEILAIDMCVTNAKILEANGITVPPCVDREDITASDSKNYSKTKKLQINDPLAPVGAFFMVYQGKYNETFLREMIEKNLKSSPLAKINLILPANTIDHLIASSTFRKFLFDNHVNILPVKAARTNQWMRDSLNFINVDGKPAINLLAYSHDIDEYGNPYKKTMGHTLACELKKHCPDLPIYRPANFFNTASNTNDQNSGGNWGVMPGGAYFTGVTTTKWKDVFRMINHARFLGQKPVVEQKNESDSKTQNAPIQNASIITDTDDFRTTPAQRNQIDMLERNGLSVTKLDISPLTVGHVDEMFNFIKIDHKSPCDYAMLRSSPRKAYELMNEDLKSISSTLIKLTESDIKKLFRTCKNIGTYKYLYQKYESKVSNTFDGLIPQSTIDEINLNHCINGKHITEWLSDKKMKHELEWTQKIIDDNTEKMLVTLKKNTGCSTPTIVDIPVFFSHGNAVVPNAVNGIVSNSVSAKGKKSFNYIPPKTFYSKFDDYIKKEIQKYSVTVSPVQDLYYHINLGEVHCGTNSSSICK
ncbi:MAG: hypothetical protein HQK51_19615, partial [Oligoflexia bacterium]|nr:hypothetical protein [Oligoflexia bacterium]